MTSSAERSHTAWFDSSAFSAWAVAHSPHTGGVGGCSESSTGAISHETCGSVPAAQSASKSPGKVWPNALAASCGFDMYALKYGST